MRQRRTLAVVLAIALVAAGCGDFLTGPKLDSDPNNPTSFTRDQLLAGIQATQQLNWTGALARTGLMWMQQFAGTDRQYGNLGLYQIGEDEFSGEFSRIYVGGGLVDLRKIEAAAEEDGDQVYKGVAEVWEAFMVGMAASLWGDIPYSEAVGDVATPKLDKQADIYAAVQQKLDAAIADLSSGTGRGPGAVDLIYGGDAQKWIAAAHTLKARFYLHWAESDASNYAKALAEAKQGIASSAGDFRTYQSSKAGEENAWYQFIYRERDSYIRPGKFLVDLMISRNDPRLAAYFSKGSKGDYEGAPPGGTSGSEISLLSTARGSPAFRQPLVTWAERQLIIAEASAKTGDEAGARSALNAERAAAGLDPVSASVAGADLVKEIMIEKYIAQFQNIDAWNDYKRTCIPQLVPAAGKSEIPARYYYGLDERNANPNIPEPSAQPQRNPNDPSGCS